MELSTRIISLKGKAWVDTRTLQTWESRQITSAAAAKFVTSNNAIDPPLTAEEFEEFAHRLGFFQLGVDPDEWRNVIARTERRKP
jgi:hypothetical protein